MKSTNNKMGAFSMEDFEKGLMLAGFISPNNIRELEERELLEEYEKELKQERKNLYFKRVVLAAEIANELHAERTFGRVKFQKLVYLCEYAVEIKVQERYRKFAAGPFDHKFMHTIEKEFNSHKWFKVEKVFKNKIYKTEYKPLENVEKYKPYFQSYFKNDASSIAKVISLFRSSRTADAEIAATLVACRLELMNKNEVILLETLLKLFYEWSDAKGRFPKEEVISVWKFIVSNCLVEAS